MITIEELKTYEQTETKLTKVCLEWAKRNLDNSCQYYAGWAFGSHGYIGINYTYNDIVNNTEYELRYGYELVSWQDLVEFSKTL